MFAARYTKRDLGRIRLAWMGLLLVALGFGLGARPVSAALIGNLSGGNAELSLDDATLEKLSEAAGHYSVRFLGVDTSRFFNGNGGILGVSAEVTFHRLGGNSILSEEGGAGGGAAAEIPKALLVFTSVRLGRTPAGGLKCVPGGQLPLADVGFVSDSFDGSTVVGAPIIVGDPAGGKVCDSESDRFVAVELSGNTDAAQRVDFEIQLRSPQPSLAFFFQYQAYAMNVQPVPEPATAALVGSGVAGLAAWRRRRALA